MAATRLSRIPGSYSGDVRNEGEEFSAIKRRLKMLILVVINSLSSRDFSKAICVVDSKELPVSCNAYQDYGVHKNPNQNNRIKDAKSQLAPALEELMKMLFNVETYRAAMMELEINMAEMPLWKLSKKNLAPKPGEKEDLIIPESLIAGAVAGISSTICTYPLELLKTLLTVQGLQMGIALPQFLLSIDGWRKCNNCNLYAVKKDRYKIQIKPKQHQRFPV
ncbi:hypothetical protein L2E82_25689 [Cichorium intybus]|uniref:Uncharacterized protein n=1 Tax=Cichorium intybus TaxID=13427 RepID=A0ACB9E478_CICIN|nr:hypothetical protein L2E82_25689 [Cichorium intybus]